MGSAAVLEHVRLDANSALPIYSQLCEQIKGLVASDLLSPGASLPTVVNVAQRYGLSTATVMRAFSQLAAEGVIVTRRGVRSRVAPRRGPSTEVIVGLDASLAHVPRQALFLQQLEEGLRSGYAAPERRFWVTFARDQDTSVREMLDVFAARRTDGVVAYRPRGDRLAGLLRGIADHLPVCTAFHALGGKADCVAVDPSDAVRSLLLERIARGKRTFALIGGSDSEHEAEWRPGRVFSPYARLRAATARVLEEAGIRRVEHLRPAAEWARTGYGDAVTSLPEGAVLIAEHPFILTGFEREARHLDVISYTECRTTLEKFRGTMDILYGGLELLGRAAARLLQGRAVDPGAPGRVEHLEPEIVRKGGN